MVDPELLRESRSSLEAEGRYVVWASDCQEPFRSMEEHESAQTRYAAQPTDCDRGLRKARLPGTDGAT